MGSARVKGMRLMTFEVPADAADDLVLVYAPNFLDEMYEIELH